MPHIFELFTQAEASTKSQAGLGIGLSVVKDNVTMHGGSVQAVSDGVGKGSEFTVRLPLGDS
jgi:signal transduction histidine kinase